MAISANSVFEVRTGGNDASGGGFVTGAAGTDYSQQDAAQDSGTNLTVHASTNTDVLPDDHTAAAADVGNIIQITAGAGFTPGFYEIKSIQTTYWRLDRSPAAAGTSGGAWALGGALATPGKAGGAASVAGNMIYLASGTYTLGNTTANTAGGPVNLGTCTAKALIGYKAGAARTDRSETPLIDAGAQTTVSIVQMAGNSLNPEVCINIAVDGNGSADVLGFDGASTPYDRAYKCLATACTTGFDRVYSVRSGATSCTTGWSESRTVGCVATDCTTGYSTTGSMPCFLCIADGGTTGFAGFAYSQLVGCVAYGCSGAGFTAAASGQIMSCTACVAINCGGYGFTGNYNDYFQCAGYNNTSGNISGTQRVNEGFLTLSGDPFVDGANGDFRPDNTASEGALLRAAWVAVYGQTNAHDIGAVQHADPAGTVVSGGRGYSRARVVNQ